MEGGELVVEQRTVSHGGVPHRLHHFHRCLADGTPPSPSIDDALGDARWIRHRAHAGGTRS